MVLVYILGFIFLAFIVFASILFGYELWKDSELRKDILEKKKREGK